jgi:hypothetical protein
LIGRLGIALITRQEIHMLVEKSTSERIAQGPRS